MLWVACGKTRPDTGSEFCSLNLPSCLWEVFKERPGEDSFLEGSLPGVMRKKFPAIWYWPCGQEMTELNRKGSPRYGVD